MYTCTGVVQNEDGKSLTVSLVGKKGTSCEGCYITYISNVLYGNFQVGYDYNVLVPEKA